MTQQIPITPEGLSVLKAELDRLQREEAPAIVEEISVARDKGDLSENAEYHAAKEKQGQIHARIRWLKDRIGRARVIDPTTLTGSRVVFGAIVQVVDGDDGQEMTYQLVGEPEADFKLNRISITSPIAQGLLGKEEGDTVAVQTPKGKRTFEITGVSFPKKTAK
jgi:transcription elongation factor GreA